MRIAHIQQIMSKEDYECLIQVSQQPIDHFANTDTVGKILFCNPRSGRNVFEEHNELKHT